MSLQTCHLYIVHEVLHKFYDIATDESDRENSELDLDGERASLDEESAARRTSVPSGDGYCSWTTYWWQLQWFHEVKVAEKKVMNTINLLAKRRNKCSQYPSRSSKPLMHSWIDVSQCEESIGSEGAGWWVWWACCSQNSVTSKCCQQCIFRKRWNSLVWMSFPSW